MNIIVCVKQVPSTNEVRLDPVTRTILRDGRQSVLNPFDIYAIEAAVRLKEQLGGRVCALSMGIPATERLLRDAMARGVDEAMLLTDRAFAGADTLATSYALRLGVEKLGAYDLILCGKMAVDGDTAQIGPELSAQLGIPCVTDVCEILSAGEGCVQVKKVTDSGFCELEVQLPALLTVTKDAAQPRFASIRGVRYSMEAPFTACSAQQAGADAERCGLRGSPTQVVRTFTPEGRQKAELLTGGADAAAKTVFGLWKEAR